MGKIGMIVLNRRLRSHINRRNPALDTDGKFMFFSNPKVCQKSILWSVLKRRAIMKTHGFRNYKVILYSLPDEYIDNIYKFTIVRNPWDRAVSAFHYIKQVWQTKETREELIGKRETFKHFVKCKFSQLGVKANPHFNYQYPCAFFREEQFVDYIGRFENIDEDWKIISEKIEADPVLPHNNKSEHLPYQHYYDADSKEIIGNIYKDDIRLFGYTYD